MATITVIVGDPAYGKERVYTTLRYTIAALEEGHQVNLFLIEDALLTAKSGQSPHELPGVFDERMPNCEALLKAAVKLGARVKLCGVCASERGLGPDDFSADAEIGSMKELVQWTLDADSVVCF